jgi:DoxX-like family
VHAPGVYGGSALVRALAALPFVIPLAGDGSQAFQPISMDDFCRVVVRAVESPELVRRSIDPVGPQVVTLRELLVDTRRWLGLPPAPTLRIPAWMVRIATLAGGLGSGPMNATALRQLDHGNTASYERFAADSGTTALSWNEALLRHPSRWQDRWHARLYFVRPILRVSLVLLWLGSSVAGLLAPDTWASLVGEQLGIGTGAADTMLSGACMLDLALAFLLAIHWRPSLVTLAQFAVVVVYTVLATFVVPALWLDPFGSLLKNLPILAAILAHGALEADR